MSPYFVIFNGNKETIKGSSGWFISFVKHTFSLVRSSQISQYFSKYSRRDYPHHKIPIILLFKEYRKEDFRTDICDLEEMEMNWDTLRLPSIPHITPYTSVISLSVQIDLPRYSLKVYPENLLLL